MANFVARITGYDRAPRWRWGVGGTDLGIPYLLENGSVGFQFGDTFTSAFPDGRPGEGQGWRSPVILRSNVNPANAEIVFDSAFGVAGDGVAPDVVFNAKNKAGTWNPLTEFTVIPNDGISFPETGRQLMSFMSMNNWGGPDGFRSGFAGIAYSDDGNSFTRLPTNGDNAVWWNTENNKSPFQMQSWCRDGEWVYMVSVRSGRQQGPIMIQRVPWDKMFFKSSYQGWRYKNGAWGWGNPDECTSVLPEAKYGEPSLRKVGDKFVLSYVNYSRKVMGFIPEPAIVTRWSDNPAGLWSSEKVQVTAAQVPNIYGGFIHPYSTDTANGLTLLVSRWSQSSPNNSIAYHVEQWRGSVT